MSEWNWPMVFLYAFVITGIVVAIVGFSQAPPEPSSAIDSSPDASEEYVPQNRSFDVRVSSGSFSPAAIGVREDDFVMLNIRTVDGGQYRLVSDSLGVDTVVGSQPSEVSFVVPAGDQFVIGSDQIDFPFIVVTEQ